ncbi:hypothetical protein Tco_0839898 [Tanacetum coccineum]|uniref:Gag protein n=1 Tax=Tanacetum coccineum TaxID=301880 RepID=A0ABQ5ARY9_9ASTR
MHNNILAAGSRDRPPMLATERYARWQSRFLRYIDTRPNGDALRKCILEGPYTPYTVIIPVVPATDESPEVLERTTIETILNMSPKNKAHYESEKEAIHLLLTGIGDEIYLTVDACKAAHEIWIAIERLQQGESLNIQDVKTNLFWEFGKFTSHDGETMESYYSRFYKMINEMIRNNLIVATMQVNVQFLQQLQPEWPRFVTIVKQQHDFDTVSYHKLFDVLKQYQKENKLREIRILQKTWPLIEKYFKNDLQPTNKQTSNFFNLQNKIVDTLQGTRMISDGQVLESKDSDVVVAYYMAKIQEVPTADPGTDTEPLEQIQYNAGYNVFANERQHFKQPESISNTCVVGKVDSNVIPDSPDMCDP